MAFTDRMLIAASPSSLGMTAESLGCLDPVHREVGDHRTELTEPGLAELATLAR